MSENQDLLYQLKKLLKQKESKSFYAKRLNISEYEVNELLNQLKNNNISNQNTESSRKVNNETGTIESVLILNYEPKDDIELARLHKINLDKYIITNYWSKLLPNGKFTSSVLGDVIPLDDWAIPPQRIPLSSIDIDRVSK